MSQIESGVRRKKSNDDLCDLKFVPNYKMKTFYFRPTIKFIDRFIDKIKHNNVYHI